MFYTYLHCTPSGDPFYVGKGSGKRAYRLNQRNAHHKAVIAKYGKDNIRIFIFPCESEESAFLDEVHQIAQLRNEGFDLVNHTDGGEGESGYESFDKSRIKTNKAKTAICEYCKGEYTRCNTGKNRFCSNMCKAARARESTEYKEPAKCEFCGKEFMRVKYKHSRFCSVKCGTRAWWKSEDGKKYIETKSSMKS